MHTVAQTVNMIREFQSETGSESLNVKLKVKLKLKLKVAHLRNKKANTLLHPF